MPSFLIRSIMSDTLLAWASKLPISAASFVGRLDINLQPILIWWGEAILFALGLDYSFLSSSILTVFDCAQSALVYMAAFILCLVWSLFCFIYCLTYMLYEWIYSYRRYTPKRAQSQSSYLRNLDAYVDPNHHGRRRSQHARHLREVHEDGRSAGVDVASDGNGAAARSSNSPCPNVMCSCPDLPCLDVPDVHVIDDLSATIRSSTNLFCPLAFPSSTINTSCSQSRRKVKRLTLRGIRVGSSSKLRQSSPLVACRSIPVTDSKPPVFFPLSSTLEYDKGIAFS
jgi:hypothetical protein